MDIVIAYVYSIAEVMVYLQIPLRRHAFSANGGMVIPE